MIYLARGAGWINLTTILNNVLSLILGIGFANLLPKETYGTYKYVGSIASILLIANLPQLNTAVTRAVSLGYEKNVSEGFKTRIKWGLISGALSLLLGIYFLEKSNEILAYSFFIIAPFLPFFQSANIYESYFLGRKNFKEHSKYKFLNTFFYTIGMLGVIFLTKNLYIIIFAYFAGYGLINTSLYYRVLKKFKPNAKYDNETKIYGKQLSFIDIINIISVYLDRIFLFHFVGAAEMAIYSFAIAIPEQLKTTFAFITPLAFPKWSKANSEEIKISIKKKMFQFLIANIALIIVYYFSAPFIYKIFLPKYTDAIFLSQIYMLSFLNIIPTFITTALQAKARIKELYIYNTITSITQIILIIFLGFSFGVWGVVIARVTSRILSSFTALLFYKKI